MAHAALLLLVFIADALIGDPPWLPHPIRLIGKAINRGGQWLCQEPSSPARDFLLGLALVVGVVLSTYLLDLAQVFT